MAVTVGQLAAALRVTQGENPAEPLLSELTRLLGVGQALVDLWAPAAPTIIKDEAVVLVAGYLFDKPSSPASGRAYANAFGSSGAQALLSPWFVAPSLLDSMAAAITSGGGDGSGIVSVVLDGQDLRFTTAAGAVTEITLPAGGGMPSSGGGVTLAQAAAIEGAVQLDSLNTSDRDLVAATDGGTSRSIKIPSISVSDSTGRLGTAFSVEELAFTGPGGSVTRAADKVTVTIPAPGISAATLAATINPVTARLVTLEQFRAAFFVRRTLATGAVIVAISNAAYRIPGRPKLPAATRRHSETLPNGQTSSYAYSLDTQVTVRVGTTAPSSHTFRLDDLVAKAAASQTDQLNDTNSIGWDVGDDTFRLAHTGGSDAEFLFTGSDIDTHTVNIHYDYIDPPGVTAAAAPAPPAADSLLPSQLKVDANTRIGGRLVAFNDTLGGFKGVALGGLLELYNGATSGLAITNSSGNQIQNLSQVATFDLDDNQHGEFHLEVSFTLSGKSATTIGFTTDRDDSWRHADVVFASTVRSASAFVLGGTIEGVEAAEVDVYNGATKIGTVRLYLGRNAAGLLGYFLDYRGAARSDSFSVGAHLSLSFMPADTPSSTGGAAAVASWATLANQGAAIPALNVANAASRRGKKIAVGTLRKDQPSAAAAYGGINWTLDAGAPSIYGRADGNRRLTFPNDLGDAVMGFWYEFTHTRFPGQTYGIGQIPYLGGAQRAGFDPRLGIPALTFNDVDEYFLLPIRSTNANLATGLLIHHSLNRTGTYLTLAGIGRASGIRLETGSGASGYRINIYEWLA